MYSQKEVSLGADSSESSIPVFPKLDSLTRNRGRNALLSALANQHCRSVIAYFRNTSDDRASVDDVAAALAQRDHADETKIAIQLHHVALPKLDGVGLVDYDERTKTVRYHGHSHLEQLEESLSESGFGMLRRGE